MSDSEQVCKGKMKSADIAEGERAPEIQYLQNYFYSLSRLPFTKVGRPMATKKKNNVPFV